MNPSRRTLLPVVALLTVCVSQAHAFPGLGFDCASCHSTPDGEFNFLPSDILSLTQGGSGQITVNVTSIPSGADAALGVDGLDVTNLMATPGAGWTTRSSGGNVWYTSALFNSLQGVVLPISLPAGAALGDYPIEVRLAGSGGWSRLHNFTLRVVVPEPATMALLAVGLVSTGAVLRNERRRRDVLKRRTEDRRLE